ncbi:MAG TPA: type II and III secretion system protein family protein [Caulobacteraceae bacterium]|nr:type II and III secretion system protein family protein [Caulobacteraceae bacterium]
MRPHPLRRRRRLFKRARHGGPVGLLPLALLSALACGLPVRAQIIDDVGQAREITVAKDKSAAFHLDYPAGEIVVAQPDTLALVATTDQSFYVRGKQIGVTNLLIYDEAHRLAQVVDVRVGYDIEDLQADLAAALPGEHIQARDFAGGVLLTGEVSTSAVAHQAEDIAERYAPKNVQSDLKVRQAQQVMVEVRMMEVTRDALTDLGLNIGAHNNSHFTFQSGSPLPDGVTPQTTLGLTSTIGSATITADLQALEQKGSVHTLAKPNLVAMSGEEASFLAGGEFPFPVPNGLTGTTIDFREFGIRLNVTPTVEDSGEIRLKVAPEVSQLDQANGISLNGVQVPGIDTTKAETSVELRDGQSFAIAGLFSKETARHVGQIPGMGDIPILGALFKSSGWKRNETELVIIVTPRLVAPTDDIKTLPDPLRGVDDPSPIDLILENEGISGPKQASTDANHGG